MTTADWALVVSLCSFAAALAKARGAKMARKPKLTRHQQQEAMWRRESGEPIRDISRTYNVHNSTIARLAA